MTDVLVMVLGSGALAAIVAGVVSVYQSKRLSREQEQARTLELLADAYKVAVEYKEYPFVIRRRNSENPGQERTRISTDLAKIQASLAYYEEWTELVDPVVGARYRELVNQIRNVAGTACRDAWNAAPIDTDAQMNIALGTIVLSSIEPFQKSYRQATREYAFDRLKWNWASRRKRAIRSYNQNAAILTAEQTVDNDEPEITS